MQNTVFTIGHSTHAQEHFIALLREHGVTAVGDVRSNPYSRMNPQFNREELEISLAKHNVAYRFLGKELGARSDDPQCYENGKVQYDRLAETAAFKIGLNRVILGLRSNFKIALMCAEKEPLDCHRTILVARHLTNLGVTVAHIHADGTIEPHEHALRRLARLVHVPEQHLFLSQEELQAEAYHRQEQRIAFEATEAAAGHVAG